MGAQNLFDGGRGEHEIDYILFIQAKVLPTLISHNVFKAVLQKSIPTQIRRRILHISYRKG